MNTNELISMVTGVKEKLETDLQTFSEQFFKVFKDKLSRELDNDPWKSQAKKIGLTISELQDPDFETYSLIFLYENQTYEEENFTSLENSSGLLYNGLVENDLTALLNPLKDAGFKIFVNKQKQLVPFIEIK